MDWDPIHSNSAVDPQLAVSPDDELGSVAAFTHELAVLYRDGAPMRVDPALARFLLADTPRGHRGGIRRFCRRSLAAAAPFAAVVTLAAANVLPAAAQSAIADAARVVGISFPAPDGAADGQAPTVRPEDATGGDFATNTGDGAAPRAKRDAPAVPSTTQPRQPVPDVTTPDGAGAPHDLTPADQQGGSGNAHAGGNGDPGGNANPNANPNAGGNGNGNANPAATSGTPGNDNGKAVGKP